MMNDITPAVQRRMALVAGYSLVAMAIVAGFGYGYGFGSIYVAGDGAATVTNLNQSAYLFRWVIVAFLVIMLLDVVVAWALYYFFKPVDEALSLLTAWLRIIYAPFLGIALMNLLAVLPLLNDAAPAESLIMRSLNAFQDVWSLGLVVFGFHLTLLGYLALMSRFVPKVLAGLALFAGLCYFLSNLANLAVPDYGQYKGTVEMALSLPMALGELALAVWLLIKGGKTKQPRFQSASAEF
ncbi:DUF4386 domain-containing protein [Nibrella saemangeumensis]|uniref:DUF4386 domain-containing protein n=1 Tax=Nibrella saemangeumensis TaxID=1084526 RepID=A0ABP8N7A7_9BACT